jgi:hypothetical protein
MRFQELYLLGCEICRVEPLELVHYADLDNCMKYLEDNDLVYAFLDKGYLVTYEDFQYKEYLDFQYVFECKEYILYFPIEIELIKMLNNNQDKKLNKWKLDCIEKVLLYGWKYFQEIYLRRILI